MDKIKLTAEKRQIVGSKIKTLRRAGILPANLFGKGIASESIQLDQKEFSKVYAVAGETHVITLNFGDKDHPVLVSDMHIHPLSGDVLHVDFRQVNLKEKIEANVPVELVGESPAEKEGNLVVLMVDEILVEALPNDLPEKFEINIAQLTEIDQAIHVGDLKIDREKVEIKTDGEIIIAKVEAPQKEEVIEAPVVAEGESPAETPAASGETKEEATSESSES